VRGNRDWTTNKHPKSLTGKIAEKTVMLKGRGRINANNSKKFTIL